MRHVIGWLLACALAGAGQPAQAQVDLAPFVQRDRYEQIKLSPDGAHLAATVPLEDRTVLVVLNRASKQIVAGGAGVKDSAVWDFWWVDDERIVISMAQTFGSKDPLYATGELHGLTIGEKRIKRLFGDKDDVGLVARYGAPDSFELATVIDPRVDEPGSVLIATWVPGPRRRPRSSR